MSVSSSKRARPQGQHRINDQILAERVFLIDSEGKNLGEISLEEALGIGEEQGLDVVEVGDKTSPPVCRLMNYQKTQYLKKKKKSDQKKPQQKLKEIQMRPVIQGHDYKVKLNQARSFLEGGNRVKVFITFRGREAFVQEGKGLELINRLLEDVKDLGKSDSAPKKEGRRINLLIQPLKS